MPEWFNSKVVQNKPQNKFKFHVRLKMSVGNFGWYERFAKLPEKRVFSPK